jgi:hypothetical protein
MIAGDATWAYLDMKPGTIWLPADTRLSVCAKRTIAIEKRMLIVVWGIQEIAHYFWVPKDGILDSPFLMKKC